MNRLSLRKSLILIIIVAIAISSISISIILLKSQYSLMVTEEFNNIDRSIMFVSTNIDMLLYQSIEKPSEALLNDTQLESKISNTSKFINERDQILSTLLLDNYLSQKYQFTKIDSLLALIVNGEGVVFNLFYPANDRTKTSEYLHMNTIPENDLKIYYQTPIKNIWFFRILGGQVDNSDIFQSV